MGALGADIPRMVIIRGDFFFHGCAATAAKIYLHSIPLFCVSPDKAVTCPNLGKPVNNPNRFPNLKKRELPNPKKSHD
jgi:hypothetical protein